MHCLNCGTENAPGTMFCTACGRSLSHAGRPVGPYLSWEPEDGAPQSLPLNRTVTIGRVDGNDIVIHDSAMSRQHARIEVTEDGLTIVDLGSLNGVLLNGERIEQARALYEGDVVQIGRTHFTVRVPEDTSQSGNGYHEVSSHMETITETATGTAPGETAAAGNQVEEQDEDPSATQNDEATLMVPGPVPMPPMAIAGPSGFLIAADIRTPIYENLTVGRAEGNDIRIENDRMLSRNHARVETRDDGAWAEDLDSANGTYLNGTRLTEPVKLNDGDEIRFGASVFRFESASAAAAAPVDMSDDSATQIAEDVQEQTLQGHAADAYIREAELAEFQALRGGDTEPIAEAGEAIDQYRLVVNFGPEAGRIFIVYRDVTVIGRKSADADYDIQLDDRAVSRPHAKIVRHPDGFVIHDLESANGTWLNYTEEIVAPRLLVDGDIVKVGKTTLVYRVPAAIRPVTPEITLDPSVAQILTFFSLKGGVGTTTLAVNLAVLLRQLTGDSVLLIDLSAESGAASVHLNVAPKVSLSDLPSQPSVIDSEVVRSLTVQEVSGIDLLPAPASPQTAELVTPAAVAAILPIVRANYKWVVIDTSSTFSELNLGVFDQSDLLMLVCEPDVTSLKVMQSTLDTFAALQIPAEKRVLVLNETHPRARLQQMDVEKAMGERIGLTVPYAGEELLDAIDRGVPMAITSRDHPTIGALENFAGRLAQVKVSAEVHPRRGGLGQWVQGVLSSIRR
jgi:pSer/pThr/pTyr-binding forkhead associated (FHA) protein/MinD-like ATPase involved in chromosome partitioning or flagellar assembly